MPEMIRKPDAEDTALVRSMWTECFPDGGPRFADWYFGSVYRSDRTLGLFDGDELLSNLQMIPYPLMLRGREIAADTLTGVATGSAHRGRGYAKAVMAEALADMARRGLGFTFLYPFDHGFYRRLGWETCSMALEYAVPAGDLPDAPPEGWRAGAAQPDISALSAIYEAYMAGCNCRSVRKEIAWQKRICENAAAGGFLLAAECRGALAGYAFCEETKDEVEATELACSRPEAVTALLAALRSKGKPVRWRAPASGRAHLPPVAWRDRARLREHVMFRVADVPEAVRQTAPACEGNVLIEIADDNMRPENNGRYLIQAENGQASAERTDANPQFSCGIGTLAAILTGFMDAKEAAEAGLAAGEGGAIELLCRIYPKQNNFLFELY